MLVPKFNPPAAQLEPHPALPPVPSAQLQVSALRQRFQQDLIWEPEPYLERRLPTRALQAPTPAAVLIPLVVREAGLHLLLTQRTAHLNDHAGQISFPGGRREETDADNIATALRETTEEIGLAQQHIEVLGQLPEYATATGYQVTPVVGLVHPPFQVEPEAFEVDHIFEVPLSFLMDARHHQLRRIDLPESQGGSRHFFAMPWRTAENTEYFIWGATAGMLRNLYRFLLASS